VTGAPMPPADLRARVLEAAQREPARPRAAGARARALVVAAGFAGMLGVAAWLGGPRARGRPLGYCLLVAASWTALAALATWAGVARGRSMLGRPLAWRIVVAAFTPAVLLAAALAAGLLWPATLAGTTTMASNLWCDLFTTLFALGPLVAFAVVRRRSDPLAPRLSGAALGAAAGAWGALGMALHCGDARPVHIVLGHLLPVAVLTLVGVLVGDRVVAVRGENG
jgi:hypothetical protein